ncbi:hypothetical protein HN51_010621 [Arachis hypogaea]|uniref:Transmembrane protein n=1 Tax=Arachis hypogaea TaxID=3818 RepID=A0A445E2N7_ARAHY|nr:uncharacterized protein LOC112789260 [Arachis hypogaea]QHO55729.1 uncharacterized protein DS421_3g67680 [Arachis hypogaea]QHO55730.1 uncharacterized protein DS421_3g67680 [Arachis hypogaea]RYR69625.1 hypothetical protein Ahy_A03g016180 [Arachis hypogaea]
MAIALLWLWNLQNLWPFSALRTNDLRDSKKLVSKLSVPEHTKQFVFAFRDPKTQTLVYVLSALNLSKLSAIDAQFLIREIRPDAVVVQGGRSSFPEILESEGDVEVDKALPTSPFGVIKQCFVEKIGKEQYESVAGNFVMKEIFGTSFHGHLLAAKKAADDVGSAFVVIESGLGSSIDNSNIGGGVDAGSHFNGFVSSLVPQQPGVVTLAPVTLNRFSLSNDAKAQMAKVLSVVMDPPLLRTSGSNSEVGSGEIQASSSYEVPAFARSIYPFLEDLHNIFDNIPSIGRALAHAQKMLLDVNRGEALDARTVSEVHRFRIAVEGIRVSLNKSGLAPTNSKVDPRSQKIDFSELSVDEKSDVLFAHAIRSQADKFKTVVAVVDAGSLGGLRKHWDTPLPDEVKELVGDLTINSGVERVSLNYSNKKRLLPENPMMAVGAGATAVLGASSLTKVVPASTLMKVATFKVPASIKVVVSYTHKALGFSLGPSKVVASSGAKTSSIMKAAGSAEKIRAIAHSVIASAERTSISVMRTAFFEIMRKRKIQPVGFLPWATFVGSIGACSGLLMCGDGIECAVESVPAAHSIASLGRGIQHLREASKAVMLAEGTRIQNSIESLRNRIRDR